MLKKKLMEIVLNMYSSLYVSFFNVKKKKKIKGISQGARNKETKAKMRE